MTPSSPPDENASLQAIAAALDLSSAVGRLRRESHSQEEQGTGTDLVSVLSKHQSKRLDSLKLLGANRSNTSHSWVNSPTGQTARTRLEIQKRIPVLSNSPLPGEYRTSTPAGSPPATSHTSKRFPIYSEVEDVFASDTEASGNNSEWTTVDSSKSAKPQQTSGDNTREPSTPEQDSAKCQPVNDGSFYIRR